MHIIATSPRSGSTFLCDALTESGAGKITEHLNFHGPRRLAARTSRTPKEFFLYLKDCKVTKLFSYEIDLLRIECGLEWPDFLDYHVDGLIRLERQDLFEMSVSDYLATKARCWTAYNEEHENAMRETRDKAEYNFKAIRNFYFGLWGTNAAWQSRVREAEKRGVPVLAIDYDAMLANPVDTLRTALEFLGNDPGKAKLPEGIRPSPPKPEGWVDRFRNEMRETYGEGLDDPALLTL